MNLVLSQQISSLSSQVSELRSELQQYQALSSVKRIDCTWIICPETPALRKYRWDRRFRSTSLIRTRFRAMRTGNSNGDIEGDKAMGR
jgi:hypothetical protein